MPRDQAGKINETWRLTEWGETGDKNDSQDFGLHILCAVVPFTNKEEEIGGGSFYL